MAPLTLDAQTVQTAPRSFSFADDGSSYVRNVDWRDWGQQTASGTGNLAVNDCKPDCGEGSYQHFSVVVHASAIGECDGHEVYTSVIATFTGPTPHDAHTPSMGPAVCAASWTQAEPEGCTVYKHGNNVRVELEGSEVSGSCQKLAQKLSVGGEFWVAGSPPAANERLEQVCALASPGYQEEQEAEAREREKVEKDHEGIVKQRAPRMTLYVVDSGSAIYGNELCGAYTHAGWTEEQGALVSRRVEEELRLVE